MVARVGRDDEGRALVKDLANAWVDTREVVATSRRTGTAFVLVDAAGENSIAVAPGANFSLEPGHATEAIGRLLAPTGVVVTQAEIPDASFAAAVRAADALGCRAVANLAPYRPLAADILALCDPLVVNETEASELLGRVVRGAEQARAAVAELGGRTRSAIVTLGAGGAVVAHGSRLESVPAPTVDVVDTTGAGDAFTGALAAALSAGYDLAEAAGIGVRAGTWAVSRLGAQASFPTAADLGLGPLHRRD
jgi:ribokinase